MFVRSFNCLVFLTNAGLPGLHYSYVKNIPPGLTLFLFNYTTRTLHGIYEAASHGQMNINKYAWTSNEGTDITAYPAQVYKLTFN